MPLKIELVGQRPKEKYEEWNKNFGSFTELPHSYKKESEILRMIFDSRTSNVDGGCKYCKTSYTKFTWIKGTTMFRCSCGRCKKSAIKGTHLENSKINLKYVVEMLYDIINNKNGLPARNRERYYGFEAETAHKILMKLSDWMGHALDQMKFSPTTTVEIDEVYPRVITGIGPYLKLKRGEGSERTHGVLVMCERNGISKAFAYDKTNKLAIKELIKKHLPKRLRSIVYTDEKTIYNYLIPKGYIHYRVTHDDGEYVNGDIHINTAEGLNSYIKNNIHYVHKGVHPAYLQLYIDRFTFIHTTRGKSFVECFTILLNALPRLGESVNRRAFNRRKKSTNTVLNIYKNAA